MTIIAKPTDPYGNRTWKVTTAPSTEPVTADEVKTFGRIDSTDEDTLIEGFIATVRDAAEKYLGRALIEQTITLLMDFWPDSEVIELPSPPLISVTGVYTTDEDDSDTEYSSSNYYTITSTENRGKIVLKNDVTPPTNTDRDYGGFKIIYKAGYGDETSDVPQLIRDAIMLWVSIYYDTRSLMFEGKPPPSVTDLLKNYVVMKV